MVIKELKEIVGNGKHGRLLHREGQLRYIARQECDDEIKHNDPEWRLWSASVGVYMCLLRMLWACC